MKVFSGERFGRAHVLRLDRGDDLIESVESMIKSAGIRNAAVVSGIGTFSECVMHMVMTTGFPPVERFERWEDKPLELSALSGVIADGKAHLHMVVSDHERAYSGHVERGCKILYLGEVVVAEIEGLRFHRERNAEGILELTEGD